MEYKDLEKRTLEDFEFRNKLYCKKGKEKIDKSIEEILEILNNIDLSIYETNHLVDLVKRMYEAERIFPQN